MKTLKIICLSIFGMTGLTSFAQELEATIQLRPRFEYRNGFKSLMPIDENAASFIAQRSRLNLNFKQDKLQVKLTLQNIRVWGDVPTTTQSDKNGIALFEAWAHYDFNKKWSARLGRQVLSYDDQRIFGEIDWAQQGQSHDAVVFSYHPKNHQLDWGGALNSNAENLIQAAYSISNYKSMQYAWYHTRLNQVNMSLLFLNTGYEYANDNADLKVDYNQTFGTYLSFKEKKIDANLGLYAQTGKRNDFNVKGWYASVNFGYAFTEKWKASVGYEFLSGKNQDDSSTTLKSFHPIFGTNHPFNGYMDYFYVGNHQNSVGLQDAFVKINYSHDKWQLALIPHVFSTAANVLDADAAIMKDYLGTEIDVTARYAFQKDITATAGYSQMLGSKTLGVIKNGNANQTNNWVWLMVSVHPKIFTTK